MLNEISENHNSRTFSDLGSSLMRPLFKPKKDLVMILRKINKTLNITAPIVMEGGDGNTDKHPPKQEQSQKLENKELAKIGR